ncbi:MAG: polyhydroxyalkanoic acid system family protein [Actinobacteria bacterium]|nr:polyhydroxyalkanoic acid system family protein [Actinomycetota bacterium]
MDAGQPQLRDRMLRDAMVEVLRGSFDVCGNGDAISLVDAGLLGQVTVAGDRVRVELALPARWSPFAGSLASEIRRRVQDLPEVTLTEVFVNVGDPVAKRMVVDDEGGSGQPEPPPMEHAE